MDRYERADFRYSICPYRDIIGCNNFMCVDCPDSSETYNLFLHYKQIKQFNYEKDYPFPTSLFETDSSCPF